MTTMKLEIPTDNATVLFHMSQALRSIAIEGGYVVQEQVTVTSEEANAVVDEIFKAASADWQVPVSMLKGESKHASEEAETQPTDAEQYGKSLTDYEDELLSPHTTVVEHESNDTIDSKGLPWDQRIHSRGKTRNSDDTWRNARCPKDKNADEWTAYIEEVETELRALMSIPVATGESPAITPPVADVKQIAVNGVVLPPVNEMPLADVDPFDANPVADVAPVTPPVADVAPVTPPVADVAPVASDVPTTFPLFMKWLTTNNKKLTKEGVDTVLKSHGIASIALLMTRSDLIPQIYADLVKMI